MYTIEQFHFLNRPETLVITQHSRKRFAERGISIDDIRFVFKTGEIIEQYPDDFPFPSCLIFGFSGERALHVVASIVDMLVYIITAYSPSSDKWEADWKTRKETSK
jgi:hypothetical protein